MIDITSIVIRFQIVSALFILLISFVYYFFVELPPRKR